MSTDSRSRPFLWAGLFVLAMSGAAAARIFDFVDPPVSWILVLLAMTLLIPATAAARRNAERNGCMSPALRRYNARFLAAGLVYMVAMITAGNLFDRLEPGSFVMWLVALAPIVPVLGMIWTMQRYLVEETDEYLRHRAVQAALFGLALVLVLGTVWGFLETFELLPHVWNWWVFPVWAIGLALGQVWLKVRGA